LFTKPEGGFRLEEISETLGFEVIGLVIDSEILLLMVLTSTFTGDPLTKESLDFLSGDPESLVFSDYFMSKFFSESGTSLPIKFWILLLRTEVAFSLDEPTMLFLPILEIVF
jgi:hypothetical protein